MQVGSTWSSTRQLVQPPSHVLSEALSPLRSCSSSLCLDTASLLSLGAPTPTKRKLPPSPISNVSPVTPWAGKAAHVRHVQTIAAPPIGVHCKGLPRRVFGRGWWLIQQLQRGGRIPPPLESPRLPHFAKDQRKSIKFLRSHLQINGDEDAIFPLCPPEGGARINLPYPAVPDAISKSALL